MQKEKKVRIELPAIDGTKSDSLPIKFKRSKKSPTSNNFLLVPASAPQIQECVSDAKWNSVEKSLQLQVRENLHFDVNRWIESIKKTYAETQKGPFVDLEQDAIMLHFLDHLGHEVFTLKFKELKLMDHHVDLSAAGGGETFGAEFESKNLIHHIHLTYKYTEEVDCSKLVNFDLMRLTDNNKTSDEEWQTVEE